METSRFEGETLVYHSEFNAGPKKIALRSVTKLSADGKLTSEEYSSADGSPEKLLVRVEAVKK